MTTSSGTLSRAKTWTPRATTTRFAGHERAWGAPQGKAQWAAASGADVPLASGRGPGSQ